MFRYLQPPEQWIKCSLESRELLGLCLAKLKGLNRVRLIDAGFVWTEPHSKRIKVKLTIQAEVLGGAVLQQVFIVDFVVNALVVALEIYLVDVASRLGIESSH